MFGKAFGASRALKPGVSSRILTIRPMSAPPSLHLLSKGGSNRSTAYAMSNKSLTLAGKTHVVWTDAIATTCGRTYDHATGRWGETRALGDGLDNHNNPTLTADAKGCLHLCYGPHGSWHGYAPFWSWPAGTFKYAECPNPGTLEGLENHGGGFGYHATYGFLVATPSGHDAIVYRGGEHPASLFFQRREPSGGWSNARELMRQSVKPGYTYYGGHLACAGDGTLYAGAQFYARERGFALGAAALKSRDMGEAWTDLRGEAAALPIEYAPRFAVPHPEPRHDPNFGGFEVDRHGNLWALTSSRFPSDRSVLLSRWEGSRWETLDLAGFLPPERVPCGSCGACFVVDARGGIHVAVQAPLLEAVAGGDPARAWGHPSNEVFHLVSRDGGKSFACRQISPGDPEACSALPNISKTGPFHPVETPAILFQHGDLLGRESEGCRSTVKTEVWCAFVRSHD